MVSLYISMHPLFQRFDHLHAIDRGSNCVEIACEISIYVCI